MDDLEITRLCARAAGYQPIDRDGYVQVGIRDRAYMPIYDRGKAMELVEHLGMRIHMETQCNGTMWVAAAPIHDVPLPEYASGSSPSILHAIGLCAARAQQARESQK